MATIDELQIEINANAKNAESAINGLIRQLHGLNDALNLKFGDNLVGSLRNLSDGLNSIKDAVNGIEVSNLKEVSGALRSLATQGRNLTTLSNVTDKVNKSLGRTRDVAKTTAKNLAEQFNIKGTKNLDNLTDALDKFYNSANNPTAARSALNYVKELVEQYGVYGNKLDEMSLKVGQAIRNADKRIPRGAASEYPDGDLNRMRGFMGIKTTKYGEGRDMSDVAAQINKDFGFKFDTHSELAAFESMAHFCEFISQNIITTGEAMAQMPDYAEQVNGIFENIAQNAGVVLSDVQEIHSIPLWMDDDIEANGLQQAGTALNEVTENAQRASAPLNNVSTSMMNLETSSGMFDNVVRGLESLGGVSLPNLESLNGLSKAMAKMSSGNVQTLPTVLPAIASAIQQLNGVTIPNLEGIDVLAKGLRSLGSKSIRSAADALPWIVNSLKDVGTINLGDSVGQIAEFAQAMRSFGYKSAQAAADTIPRVTQAFLNMASALASAPQISQNTIDLANAMANLAANGGRVSTGMNRAHKGLKLFGNGVQRAQKQTHSLASTIGKITATYWLLFRALGKVKDAIDLASDLTEVQNVVNQTFKDESYKMDDFAKRSIKDFGMAELQAKQVASRFQAMGKGMEIPNEAIAKSSKFLSNVSERYGKAANSMADMSIELTKLTADMGSFYNMDYDEVAQKMEAIFTGQTRPLRTFGIDLTEANLKQWALNNGLDANIKKMTQAQKAMLRYQYVLAHTNAAQGDFERTQETWANQTRMLKQNFAQLGAVIGKTFINAFKPAVKAMNAFLLKVTSFAEQVFNALGQIFGWKVEINATGIADDYEDAADAAGSLADNTGDAADNAKELNKQLASFDKLNNLTTSKDKSGSGSGSGAGAGGGGAGSGKEGSVKSSLTAIESNIKDLETLGKTIASTIADTLENINWEKDVYPKAEKFGKGLADFMNGLFAGEEGARLFKSLGSTIAGAVNTVMIAAKTWADELEWEKIGTNIKEGLVEFLTDWTPEISADAVGGIASGIASAVYSAVSDEKSWELLGDKIGTGIDTLIARLGKKDKNGNTFWENVFGSVSSIANGISTAVGKAVSKIKWKSLGTDIKTGIEKFLKTWKPEITGSSLAKLASGLATALYEIVSDKETWSKLGKKIGDGVNAFLKGMNEIGENGMTGWETLFADITDVLLGLATAIGDALANVDWNEAIDGIGRGLKKALEKIADNPDSVIKLIGVVTLTGFGKSIGGAIAPSIGTGITTGIKSAFASGGLIGWGGIFSSLGGSLAVTSMFTEEANRAKQIKDNPGSTYMPVNGLSEEEYIEQNNEFINVLKKKFETLLGGLGIEVPVVIDATAEITKTEQKLREKDKVIDKATANLTKTYMKKLPEKMRTIPGIADFYKTKAKKLTEKMRTIPGVADFQKTKYDKLKEKDKTIDAVADLKKTYMNNLPESMRTIPGIADFMQTKAEKLTKEMRTIPGVADFQDTQKSNLTKEMKTIKSIANFTSSTKSNIPKDAKTINTIANFTSSSKSGLSKNDKTISTIANYTKASKGSLTTDDKTITSTAKITKTSLTSSASNINVTATVKQIKIPDNVRGIPGVYDFYAHKKANGGIFKNGVWKNIAQFASGGLPTHGSMFIAGERGAEVVGHIGGQTEVLNESQLASVMYSAVVSAMGQQNSILIKQNEYLAGILAKDYGISSRDIFNATRSEATSYYNRTGRPAFEG